MKKAVLSVVANLKSKPIVGIIIISAFYFFGVIGILSANREWFVEKTAFNLSLSFVVLIMYQNHYKFSLIWAFVFCYVVGFLAEYLGVNFGLIFGDYYYPKTLGPQLGGVPVIIGINWFLITFCVASLIFPLKTNVFLKILLATITTVIIDVLIEPVAMELNFWNWENNEVPLQNYVGWAIVSFLIFSFYFLIKIPLRNKMSIVLLFWQVVFFVVLNLFLVKNYWA
ncbi:carotenoid biosynthesis protein [Marivirga harenae]|uniref:carotenoid biosynthesis protein n=1 Tax=Marivirga harenae TaxID=2010992 RepID=UPI0026DEF446|nr:carotenoid biosynthesis protein [Marivirga harenae]WKV13544.1 carotenoid biosynthesis protein [Marivirga harenae]|tara:strand:+ start:182799 stop:183476 length:678 start_codon:yes stop_codon:yes gene_type:complete